MSAYNARRAPNVSRYLANLNTSPQEIVAPPGPLALGDDSLDFLTNTEFFDFDQFNPTGAFDQQPAAQNDGLPFSYDFQTFPHNSMTSPSTLPPSPQNGFAQGYAAQMAGQQFASGSPVTGDKRKASIAMPLGPDQDDLGRMAAEEDKRRRNTAASARFRVKKKQREQALEKQTKEMSDKVQQLESKVQQLEMENKWLKGLITEKADGVAKSSEVPTVPVAVADKQQEKEAEERSLDSRTVGVGTAAEAGEA